MPFDLAWGFRSFAGWVTDPAYQVPGLGEDYPHTYTASNGYSINAGWTQKATNFTPGNADATNDARIAGWNAAQNTGTIAIFRADLDSGSNPGAGDYSIDCAFGDAGSARTTQFKILDNTTVLIDGSSQGTIVADHYWDATLTEITATTTWTGTATSKTFASAICFVQMALNDFASYSTIAHFRLTLQEGAPTFALDDTGLSVTPAPTRRVVPVW